MNIKSKRILLGAIACLVCGTANSPAGVISLGTFTPFYRNTQLQGHLVSGGMMIQDVPDYLRDSTLDFPYVGQTHGIPYVDHVSITRYMGGFPTSWASKDEDLAYKDVNGVVVLRDGANGTADKIQARTAPYIAAGYEGDTLTVTLDNVPWDLARIDPETGLPVSGPYGQSSPPADWNEWYATVRGVCQKIQTVYQGKLPEQIRFKMGTEYNTPKSFSGTQEDYFKYYDWSVAAVKSVFPNAFVMPCEQGGSETGGTVNMLEFMDHVASGVNYATGGTGTPINGIARSLNCFGGPEIDPRTRVQAATRTFSALTNRNPRFHRSDLTYEIHQMGWGNNEYGVSTNEPGVRGAVWYFDILAGLKAINSLDYAWHWGQIATVKSGSTWKYLPTTLGLLMQVLDSFEGMQWYILDNPADTANGTFYRASLFVGDTKRYLLVTSYNVDRTISNAGGYAEVKIPKAILDLGATPAFACRAWHEDNSVYSLIRNDLYAAGNLHTDYSAHAYTYGSVSSMSANATTGQQMVVNNFDRYSNQAKQMLKTNQSYTGTYSTDGTDQTLRFYMRNTSIMILKL